MFSKVQSSSKDCHSLVTEFLFCVGTSPNPTLDPTESSVFYFCPSQVFLCFCQQKEQCSVEQSVFLCLEPPEKVDKSHTPKLINNSELRSGVRSQIRRKHQSLSSTFCIIFLIFLWDVLRFPCEDIGGIVCE